VVPSRNAWSSGFASWFKANGFCYSVGGVLATLNSTLTVTSTTQAFIDYLVGVSATDPFWVGLSRNPWVWVEEYDNGKITRLNVDLAVFVANHSND